MRMRMDTYLRQSHLFLYPARQSATQARTAGPRGGAEADGAGIEGRCRNCCCVCAHVHWDVPGILRFLVCWETRKIAQHCAQREVQGLCEAVGFLPSCDGGALSGGGDRMRGAVRAEAEGSGAGTGHGHPLASGARAVSPVRHRRSHGLEAARSMGWAADDARGAEAMKAAMRDWRSGCAVLGWVAYFARRRWRL
ncbi:hypothetical protein BC834DRAFT_271095 [Gloeopeniophorella convolvens]|nr:hypothetical protein BC834DRAFT_271095 [Gloeopeniophorella convolvens]